VTVAAAVGAELGPGDFGAFFDRFGQGQEGRFAIQHVERLVFAVWT
jgi:hypothetical protein